MHPQCRLIASKLVSNRTQTHRLVFRRDSKLFKRSFDTCMRGGLLRRRDSGCLQFEISICLESQLPHILVHAYLPLYFRLNVFHFTLLAHLGIQSK